MSVSICMGNCMAYESMCRRLTVASLTQSSAVLEAYERYIFGSTCIVWLPSRKTPTYSVACSTLVVPCTLARSGFTPTTRRRRSNRVKSTSVQAYGAASCSKSVMVDCIWAFFGFTGLTLGWIRMANDLHQNGEIHHTSLTCLQGTDRYSCSGVAVLGSRACENLELLRFDTWTAIRYVCSLDRQQRVLVSTQSQVTAPGYTSLRVSSGAE